MKNEAIRKSTSITLMAIMVAGGLVFAIFGVSSAAYVDNVLYVYAESEVVGEVVVLNTKGSSVPGCETTNDCFVPPVVTININEKIVWKNVDTAAHTVTSGVLSDGGPDGVFDSGLFVPGVEFSHTFDTPGEYPYFCIVHPWMAGLIVVQETVDDATSGQPYVDIENDFFMDVGEAVVLNTKGSSVPGCETTNDCFVPPVVTININEKIVWKNVDTAAHTVTSGVLSDGGPDGVFDSGLFVPGVEFSHTFDTPGEYPYFCIVHPWMAGLIVVQETVDDATSGQPYVNIENNFFMEFPKEWSVQNMYGADQPTVAAAGSSIAVVPPNIAVYVEEAGNHTLNTVRESRLADLKTLDNLEILNHELVSINNFDVFVLDVTDVFDSDTASTNIKYRQATIVSSDKIYTFLFSATLSDFDSYAHYFTESLESFRIIMRESYESSPQRTIQETVLRLEFYDSKSNHYVWTLPISAYEDAVFESRLKSTSMVLNPLRLSMDDGETISTIGLDGFVRGSFSNIIDDVYNNSYDNTDFIWEVWHIVSQLTVYDPDVHLHSEGRFATETFSRGGGDCEDLAILIADMLASSEHTVDWNIQYLYMDTDNPTDPQTVNHVMLHVDDGVHSYLIEATGKPSWDYYPDGVRGWFINARG
ncbi:MAG: hypothetical protein F4X71_02805 [Cenarchaeum sp. SB0662_bin_33]|nr:hypothetical protein [Cenarchaeum sp. SB0662_bin_33]